MSLIIWYTQKNVNDQRLFFYQNIDLEETFTGTMNIIPFYYPTNNVGNKMDLTVPLFCLPIFYYKIYRRPSL